MRCPKCSYLSYDDVERCRNCGYDFALATHAARGRSAPGARRHRRTSRAPWEPHAPPAIAVDGHAVAGGGRAARPAALRGRRRSRAAAGGDPASRPAAVGAPQDRHRRGLAARCRAAWPMPHSTRRPASASTPSTGRTKPTAPEMPVDRAEPSRRRRVGAAAPSRWRRACARARSTPSVLVGIDALVLWLTLRVAGVSTSTSGDCCRSCRCSASCSCSTRRTWSRSRRHRGRPSARCSPACASSTASRRACRSGMPCCAASRCCCAPSRPASACCPLFLDPERRGAHDRLAGTRVVPAD